MDIPVTDMIGPKGDKCYVNTHEVSEWIAKGYKVAASVQAPKDTEPLKTVAAKVAPAGK